MSSASTPKDQWRKPFDEEPLPFKRDHIEGRRAYRSQERAYLPRKPAGVDRLVPPGERLDCVNVVHRQLRDHSRPLAGPRLIRERQGVQRVVTALVNGFAFEGGPYQSPLPSLAPSSADQARPRSPALAHGRACDRRRAASERTAAAGRRRCAVAQATVPAGVVVVPQGLLRQDLGAIAALRPSPSAARC